MFVTFQSFCHVCSVTFITLQKAHDLAVNHKFDIDPFCSVVEPTNNDLSPEVFHYRPVMDKDVERIIKVLPP